MSVLALSVEKFENFYLEFDYGRVLMQFDLFEGIENTKNLSSKILIQIWVWMDSGMFRTWLSLIIKAWKKNFSEKIMKTAE